MKQNASEPRTADTTTQPTEESEVQQPKQAAYAKPNLETHAKYRVLIGAGGSF